VNCEKTVKIVCRDRTPEIDGRWSIFAILRDAAP